MPPDMQINYMTEDPAKEYSKRINAARGFRQLHSIVMDYAIVCWDAIKRIERATAEEWPIWRDALKVCKDESAEPGIVERANDDWGDVLMPRVMLLGSLTSIQFKVPWGLAIIRLEDAGRIIKGEDGRYEIADAA